MLVLLDHDISSYFYNVKFNILESDIPSHKISSLIILSLALLVPVCSHQSLVPCTVYFKLRDSRMIGGIIISMYLCIYLLTHWDRVTHKCFNKITIICSDNGLSLGQRQVIIWTNAEIMLIGPLGTYFNEILTEIQKSSFNKMHSNMSSAKWRPFCFGLSVLKYAWNSVLHSSVNQFHACWTALVVIT